MDLLADENVEPEWIQALEGDGHDVLSVVEAEELGASSPDADVLAATGRLNRVLVTADRSDFGEPPTDDHAGIVIIADVTRSGGEIRRAVRLLDSSVPDLSGRVAYVSDWL